MFRCSAEGRDPHRQSAPTGTTSTSLALILFSDGESALSVTGGMLGSAFRYRPLAHGGRAIPNNTNPFSKTGSCARWASQNVRFPYSRMTRRSVFHRIRPIVDDVEIAVRHRMRRRRTCYSSLLRIFRRTNCLTGALADSSQHGRQEYEHSFTYIGRGSDDGLGSAWNSISG